MKNCLDVALFVSRPPLSGVMYFRSRKVREIHDDARPTTRPIKTWATFDQGPKAEQPWLSEMSA